MNNNAAFQWSSQQEKIFSFFKTGHGNLIVRARAGCGKTTTILQAVTYAKERRILLVAFNKNIAEELQRRLKNPNAYAKTLHSLGFSFILKSHWGELPKGLKISVNTDRGREIAHDLLKTKENKELFPVAIAVAKLASLAKGAAPFATVEELMDLADTHGIEVTTDDEKVAEQYNSHEVAKLARRAMDKALEETGEIDFDDMIFVTIVKKLAKPEYGMVCVDEAQDMNAAQLLLAQAVCMKGGRVVIVGDDRQACYGFRGADSGAIDRMKTELKATELGLTVTRRCPKKVVELAQNLVPDFEAAPEAPEGEVVTLDGSKLIDAVGPGDFILSRTNAPLVSICFALLRNRKRAKIQGKDIGKTLLSVVKKLKAKSIEDFKAKVQIWAMKERKKAEGKKESVADAIISRANDQEEMLGVFADEAQTMGDVERLINDLFDDADPSKAPFAVCSSVHKAKGLEQNRVFVCEETFYKGHDFAQEQNLVYIAYTRAKQVLFLVPKLPDFGKK